MYAELVLHQYRSAFESAGRYLLEIDTPHSSEIVREEGRNKYSQVVDLTREADDERVDDIINNWRIQNARFLLANVPDVWPSV